MQLLQVLSLIAPHASWARGACPACFGVSLCGNIPQPILFQIGHLPQVLPLTAPRALCTAGQLRLPAGCGRLLCRMLVALGVQQIAWQQRLLLQQ